MTEVKTPDEKIQIAKRKKYWMQTGFGAVIGFICGYGGLKILLNILDPQNLEFSIDLIIAGGVALMYFIMGLFFLVSLLLPRKHGVKLLNVEDEEELDDLKKIAWGSSFGSMAIGVAILLLILSGPDRYFHPAIGFSVMTVTFIFAIGVSVKEWPHYDEMMRKLTIDSTYLTASILFTITWFWCSAAWVGWVAMPSPIILLALFMGVYLLSVFIIAGKMGLTETR